MGYLRERGLAESQLTFDEVVVDDHIAVMLIEGELLNI